MENQTNNKVVTVLLVVIIVILSALCVLFATGTISFKSNKEDSNEIHQNANKDNNDETNESHQNINDDDNAETNDENDKQPEQNVTDNDITQEATVRTYRFFGYSYDRDPDMYTTLKLYSNGNYVYYINNCEGLAKYSGTYNETNTKISLSGDITTVLSGDISFNKIDNGNSLEFNFTNPSCSDTGGSFSLESYILGD